MGGYEECSITRMCQQRERTMKKILLFFFVLAIAAQFEFSKASFEKEPERKASLYSRARRAFHGAPLARLIVAGALAFCKMKTIRLDKGTKASSRVSRRTSKETHELWTLGPLLAGVAAPPRVSLLISSSPHCQSVLSKAATRPEEDFFTSATDNGAPTT